MASGKVAGWAHAEEYVDETALFADEGVLARARERGHELGAPPVLPGAGALTLVWLIGVLAAHAPNRSITSRASARYASAPADFGAHVVMGSPATLVSGKRTVRLMTVSNTRSPNRSTTLAITSRALTVRGS